VRIWDVEVPADPGKNADGEVVGTGGQADATRITGAATTGQVAASGGKKKVHLVPFSKNYGNLLTKK